MPRILVLSNFGISDDNKTMMSRCNACATIGVEFHYEPGEYFDLVCVLNAVKKPQLLRAPSGGFIKIVQEPSVPKSVFHRFVNRHPKVFSLVVGHSNALSNQKDSGRFMERPAFLFPHVSALDHFPPKNKLVSIIASSLTTLDGHKRRNALVRQLVGHSPELSAHAFGWGRQNLIKKEDALDDYMYSFAIENSSIGSYVTEKFSDCVLRGTVPIYFGAPNLSELLPEGSFIQLEKLTLEAALEVLGGLSHDDYLSRLPALREAQQLILSDWKLGCFLTSRLPQSSDLNSRWRLLLPPMGEVLKWLGANVMKMVQNKPPM